MFPPNMFGGPLGTRPIDAGGATPITPQNGFKGTTTPGAYSTVLFSRSSQNTRSSASENLPEAAPRPGTNPCPAMGSLSSTERMRISSVSPGCAPDIDRSIQCVISAPGSFYAFKRRIELGGNLLLRNAQLLEIPRISGCSFQLHNVARVDCQDRLQRSVEETAMNGWAWPSAHEPSAMSAQKDSSCGDEKRETESEDASCGPPVERRSAPIVRQPRSFCEPASEGCQLGDN